MHKSGKILFFLLSFLPVLLHSQLVRAESPSYKIYTTEEGLAHDSVNKIARDSRGFLWFCTSEGLSRFDGRRFTNFTQDQGLPDRNVTSFLELRDGTYLIGTNQGLVVFNPNGRAYRWNVLESRLEKNADDPPMFQTFTPDTTIAQKKEILSLAEDTEGTIWVGTAFGLFRVTRGGDGDWRLEEFEVDKKFEMPFYSLLPDSKGGLLICAAYSAYRLFRGQVEKFDPHGGHSLFEDRDGNVWVGAGGAPDGLRLFQFVNDKLMLVRTYRKADGLVDDSYQSSIKQTSDGRLYIGQFRGLVEFIPSAKPDEAKFRVLGTDIINALAEDSVGNLWIGTHLKGAWQLTRSGFSLFGEKDGIAESEDIRSIYTNRDGELFLPTRPQKILHLTGSGKFESVLPLGVTARNWGWGFMDFQSSDGEWWVAALDGLRRYPKVARFSDLARTAPKHIYTARDGLWTDLIFEMFEDSRGDIWITVSTPDEATLCRWERKTDRIYAYSMADGVPKGNGAISFAEDLHGNVWFGHYFGKLTRYRDGKFQVFSTADGLPENQIDDLLTDSGGRLWIATTGRGLFRINEPGSEKPLFTSISTQNGLSSNQVICLTEDAFGRVYAGTGRGINRIDQNGFIKIFTQSDGLPGNFITRCAADEKGDLWFVSQNKLVRLTPEIENEALPPPVFIDKFSVNGVPQKISVLGETEIRLPDLSSNQTQIEIDFFALTFGVGENTRYQYRLDEQDWSNPTDQQTLNLQMTTGQHNFELRAVRTDGVVSEKSATVSFKILRPVWQRWWFITLCAMVLAGIVILVYRYRTANLRKINAALTDANLAEENLRKSKEERLAELEKLRSRIATDLHDDIGASLTRIAVLSEVAQAQNKGNIVTESLSKISNVSNELVETMSDIVWSINPAKDHLSDLTQRMRRFASDVLSAKGIALQFHATNINNEALINTNLRREIFLIFKESVNNIVKHSDARQATINLQISDKNLKLRISDDGQGFDMEKAFEDQFSSFGMGGNGISSMRKRAAEMNGHLDFLSEIGKGTTVNLSLPLEQIIKS